jgi:hypothetical protein
MCLITAGHTKATACDIEVVPGIKWDKLWFGNKTEMTMGAATNKRIATITMDTGKTMFKVDVHRNSGSFTDVMQVSENSGDTFMQTFIARTIEDENTTIEQFEDFKGADLIIVAQTKGDEFVIIGEEDGARMTGWEYGTGNKGGDDAGLVVTFTSEQQSAHNRMFITDTAGTIAYMDALL